MKKKKKNKGRVDKPFLVNKWIWLLKNLDDLKKQFLNNVFILVFEYRQKKNLFFFSYLSEQCCIFNWINSWPKNLWNISHCVQVFVPKNCFFNTLHCGQMNVMEAYHFAKLLTKVPSLLHESGRCSIWTKIYCWFQIFAAECWTFKVLLYFGKILWSCRIVDLKASFF